MTDQPAILVQAASKVFRFSRSEVSFAESLLRVFRRSAHEEVEVVAIQDIDLHIEPGEWVGLIGDNGAGKSTLLRLLAGIYAPTRGSVTLNGSPVLLAGFGTGMVD
jgi:ABC-type polysaccharide/polyol phosphate transport system ATPase subunit